MEAENSRSLETNENESQDYQLEYHNTIFSEHEMEVDGVVLKEKKETTTIREVKHIRTIGDQTLTIHQQMILNESGEEVEGERHIDTDMDESEIPSFLQKWDELWNPKLSDQNVEKIIQNPDTRKN